MASVRHLGWSQERWIAEGRARADVRAPELSKLLSDDQIGALYGYSTNDVYKAYNLAMRQGTATPEIMAFAEHATEGLARLPRYVGAETYRGTDLPLDVLNRMQMGAVETDMAFFSSSATTPFAGNTQMVVRGVSGKDISFPDANSRGGSTVPAGYFFQGTEPD
ncbi:hypothetical protein PPS11_16201 [Pseudomonas putida S11]|nr:hypothetical protein PPS11_16201 [Pseudomonas putida S11]